MAKFVKIRGSSKVVASVKRKVQSSMFVTDITETFMRVMGRQDVLLVMVLTAAVVVSHADNWASGPLGPFLDKHKDNPIVKWINDNHLKVMGFFVSLPTLTSMSYRQRGFAAMCTFAAIFLLKPMRIYYYVCISVFMLLYLKVKSQSTRTVLLMVGALVCYTSV